MHTINPEQIILGPVITEKSIAAQSHGIYSFWVTVFATKHQIETAIQAVFNLNPLTIKTSILKGKLKSDPRKRMPIQKPTRKKAVVTFAKDTKIELLSLNTK